MSQLSVVWKMAYVVQEWLFQRSFKSRSDCKLVFKNSLWEVEGKLLMSIAALKLNAVFSPASVLAS